MQIKIYEPEIRTFTITTQAGPREVTKQNCYADLGQRFPVLFEVDIESPAYAYPAGDYDWHPESYEVDQYQNLVFKRYGRKLMPVTAAKTNERNPVTGAAQSVKN